jgi:pantothenate synthetase
MVNIKQMDNKSDLEKFPKELQEQILQTDAELQFPAEV